MKIVRFSHQESIRYGIVDEAELVVLAGDPMFAGFDTTGERVPLAEVSLLTPVIPRSKVVCVGKNYHDHAAEMGGEAPAEPLLFLKPNTAVIGPGDAIVRPPQSTRTDFEGELAVVIGRIAKNVPAASALDYVFGYTIGNDVTARDLQKSDGQWARAKGFDTFCPFGPVIATGLDPAMLVVRTILNNEVRQDYPINDMVFSAAQLVSLISRDMTLDPGDILLCGTSVGVGSMRPGSIVEVEIDGIGKLSNRFE